MNQDHLSRISTIWTMVFTAHGQDPEAVKVAQSALMERYSGVVYRYLLRALGNVDAADEVFQQFALSFVRGGFRHANPERGRFRDYLKASLVRLIASYRKNHARAFSRLPVTDACDVGGALATDEELDREFVESCRDELLSRAWQALEQFERRTGRPLFSVLDYRARNPDASSTDMARALTERRPNSEPFTAAGIRKLLQRARETFADLLLAEVARTLDRTDRHAMEQEVIDLGLHPYCRSAIERRYR